jgi:hypothetical protein
LDYFSIQLGMSSSQLTSSIIFQKGGTTTFTGEFHSQPCLNKLEGIQDQLHLLHLHLACRVFFFRPALFQTISGLSIPYATHGAGI